MEYLRQEAGSLCAYASFFQMSGQLKALRALGVQKGGVPGRKYNSLRLNNFGIVISV
jgi:hypothetical protein